jgi:NAD(P)-dependent dehydrogenase (short-subunit alcohol dehydrogenase family)
MNVDTLFSLRGKTALITGGSRGIGRMIAEGFIGAGATVYICARKREACDATAAELSADGDCRSLPADVTTVEGRASLVASLGEQASQLDILVNNAGANWGAPYEDYPVEGFQKVLDLNVLALFFLTRELTPMLEKSGQDSDPARVINIGSIDGIIVPTILPLPTFAYSASKAAVHHLTRTLAVELAPRNITVNAVAPGYFESKMTRQVLKDHGEAIKAACPLGRIGQPEEMAGVAIYLASKAGAFTSGAVIPVDGGASIA